MDWLSKKSWDQENALYAPKRKVNNKGSRDFPHIIGSFPSQKTGLPIDYESLWGECLFYYYLEIEPLTIRFYPQPVIIELSGKRLNAKTRVHVPDVLGFRQGSIPHLFQVKGGDVFIEQKPEIYDACLKYANFKGWRYSVVRPKIIPSTVKRNLQLLVHYKYSRPYYPLYNEEILKKVGFLPYITVDDLSKSFKAKADYRDILPIIYHLIFLGKLQVDILKPIGLQSELMIGNISNTIFNFFELESN